VKIVGTMISGAKMVVPVTAPVRTKPSSSPKLFDKKDSPKMNKDEARDDVKGAKLPRSKSKKQSSSTSSDESGGS